MQIKTVGVLGCGLMGSGIAQVCAAAGYKTIVRELDESFLNKGLGRIKKFLDDGVAKGKVAAEARDTTLGNLSGATEVDALKSCDLIIEAIIENLDEKRATYAALEKVVSDHVVFLSNTSSLCITELAAATTRPDRFGGLHFFNPVPIMQLIEIIRALQTSQETFDTIRELSVKLGKTPIEVQDSPGFVSNRVLMPLLNEAMFTLMEGVASAEDIDTAVKLGLNHPMGPLTLADYVGLDVCLDVMEVLHRELGDPKFRPCPLLRKMVDAGYLGRKSGQGFYKY
jgi:3-hydroxybutyryl-CoA dehydrogenase